MKEKTKKPNWSEESKLLEEYTKRKHLLKSKFDPQITANRKQQMLEEIERKMNSRCLVKWSIQEVQINMTTCLLWTKKEITNYRRESKKTGKNNIKV